MTGINFAAVLLIFILLSLNYPNTLKSQGECTLSLVTVALSMTYHDDDGDAAKWLAVGSLKKSAKNSRFY